MNENTFNTHKNNLSQAPHYAYVSNERTEDPSAKKDKEVAEHPYSTSFTMKKNKPTEADDTTPTLPDRFLPAEENQETDDEHNSTNNVRITRFNEPLMQF